MELRKKVVYVRLTEKEYRSLEEKSKEGKISISALCRRVLLEKLEMISEIDVNDTLDNHSEDVDIHIKLSKRALKEIDDFAYKSMLSRSKYIERATLEHTVILDGLKEFTREINRLGNNMNQIVVLANQGVMKTIDFTEFKNLVSEVIKYLIDVKKSQKNGIKKKSK